MEHSRFVTLGLFAAIAASGCEGGTARPDGTGIDASGSSTDADPTATSVGSAPATVGSSDGADSSGSGPSMDMGGPPPPPPDPPMPLQPCDMGSCWSTLTFSGYCGSTAIAEDFSSGAFNVHEFELRVRAGIPAQLVYARTGGDVAPAIVIHDEAGQTVYDGELGLVSADLVVEAVETGSGSDVAIVDIIPQADLTLAVFVTSWAVIDGGFAPPMPTDVTYDFEVFQECPVDTGTFPPPNFDPGNVVGGYHLLPDSEPPGLYERKPDDCSRGNQRLIDVIYTAASRFHELRPEYTPILVRDLNEGSCSTVDHATHDDGTHVDIVASCATDVSCSDFVPAMDLARLFVDTGEVCGILFNDTRVQDSVNPYFYANHAYAPWNGDFMRTVDGHTQHFHVRVKKPDGTCN